MDKRIPGKVQEWLQKSNAALRLGEEAFARHIACGGLAVEVAGSCDCTSGEKDEALLWMHLNHHHYNAALRDMIAQTIGLPAFRSILERDLAESNGFLRKDYAQQLIDNFVDTTAWC